ncbi:MAG: hypothetical protein CML08_04330 [Puniceicoccaceae bacterium]|nr:hypothetical protein [Puniceicoccaceae bacterium]|tara:strand:- start:2185 stop:2448 length:264 start_codon:yes stop_codon:yes gene_type:complete
MPLTRLIEKQMPRTPLAKKTILSEFFFIYALGAILLSNFFWFDLLDICGDDHKLKAIYTGIWVPTTMALSYAFKTRPHRKLTQLKYK